jgi:hypothetical protein
MANLMFNNERGSLIQHKRDSQDLIIVLLKVAQADATLRDHDSLSAILAAANTEADFTNYARKTIANASWTITIDDTGEDASADFADQTWTAAGGASNNTLVKLLVCIDGANDAARLPVTLHDFATTTDGNDLTAVVDAAGFYASTD